jgi:hypothetical protein
MQTKIPNNGYPVTICGAIGLAAPPKKTIGRSFANVGLNGTTFTASAKKTKISAAKMKTENGRLTLFPMMNVIPKYAKYETIDTVHRLSKEKIAQSRML